MTRWREWGDFLNERFDHWTEDAEQARCAELMRHPSAVFVFGSNLLGVHGAGAARDAVDNYGAAFGIGEGPQGRSYAIPTKPTPNAKHKLAIDSIRQSVLRFVVYARLRSDQHFILTRVGCGRAGYTALEIAPLFSGAPENVWFPPGWGAFLDAKVDSDELKNFLRRNP